MQTRNPLLDDLARLMSGAMGAAGGMKEEMEARLRERLQRVLAGMDLPTREEFDAVKELAARAPRRSGGAGEPRRRPGSGTAAEDRHRRRAGTGRRYDRRSGQ